MTDNVLEFRPHLVGDGARVSCDDVLNSAVGKLDQVAVIGLDADGDVYIAGSDGSAETVFLMERAKLFLLQYEVGRS